MLVLSRKESEVIVVRHRGELLRILVVEIRDNHKARLGFEGPKSFEVDREEVYEEKSLEGR